jgi:hypothetical protein
MSGVEIAAVVVPASLVVGSGALAVLKGPAAMLRNTQTNVDASRFLIAENGAGIEKKDRDELEEECDM